MTSRFLGGLKTCVRVRKYIHGTCSTRHQSHGDVAGHADKIIQDLQLSNVKGADVSASRSEFNDFIDKPFGGMAWTSDYCANEDYRSMSSPMESDCDTMKTLGRDSNSTPQIIKIVNEELPKSIGTNVDADYICEMKKDEGIYGRHAMMSWTRTQTVADLSTVEAEYYRLTRSICESIDIKIIPTGIRLESHIRTDTPSSETKDIATCRGQGNSITWRREHSGCGTRLMRAVVLMRDVNRNVHMADLGTILSGCKKHRLVSRLPLAFGNETEKAQDVEPVTNLGPSKCVGIEIHILCSAYVEPSWEVPIPSAMTRKK